MRTVFATLLLAILAACGGASEGDQADEPSSSASKKTWSKDKAGKKYVTMAKPGNAVVKKLNTALGKPDAGYKTLAPICEEAAADLDKFMRKLAAGKWPADVTDEVDAVSKQMAAERTAFQQCARSTDDAQVNTALQAALDAAADGAPQSLRVALGLPGSE